MGLAADLLAQARHLARKEPRRPKQASLRRAVATAYYALFHLLVEEAAQRLVGGKGAEREALRAYLKRAFAHGPMRQAARSFRGPGPPDSLAEAVPEGTVEPALQQVARTFERLQIARHAADYDSSARYTRYEIVDYVNAVASAFEAWDRLRREHRQQADAFLVALLVHARRRG